ncbi:MAG: hypothetical protein PHW52_01600 [Candidatus Pacebacteria bacterium]|nr:hypothetical protein [Candidatus Paceibacterota bacterium]
MFKGRTNEEWIKAYKDFAAWATEEMLLLALLGGATDWPMEVIEGVRDALRDDYPEISKKIDERLCPA